MAVDRYKARLIIDFKHEDVDQPKPWPIGINDDNIVTSGLGNDDGAVWIGFARKGEQAYFASPRDLGTIDFEKQDIVPVFTKDGQMFNWDIAIREIRAIEVMADEPIITGPITRTCPACNARPGQPCTQPTDTGRRAVTWFHLPREETSNG